MATALHQRWLADQKVSLAAGIINGYGGKGLESESSLFPLLARSTQVISDILNVANLDFLSDASIALVSKTPGEYLELDSEILPDGVALGNAINTVKQEQELRLEQNSRLSKVQISYVVYLLRQQHISSYDFFKWLKRNGGKATKRIDSLLKLLTPIFDEEANLGENELAAKRQAELDKILEVIRNPLIQNRYRVDAVDKFYDVVVGLIGETSWWLRSCLALRNSLYCWPLMISGLDNRIEHDGEIQGRDDRHGISLPIGLFLSSDGSESTFFKIVGSARRFQPATIETNWLAGMEGSQLRWDSVWGKAFNVGLRVAKNLWSTQNGRLKFADELAAAEVLSSSIVVDVGPACEIVDSVFQGLHGLYYDLSGRSAEAYWVQVVLGLLLPEKQIPQGVVTGCISDNYGAFDIGYVEGIPKKLDYANNAGFPRVILPGNEFEELEGSNFSKKIGIDRFSRDRALVEGKVNEYRESLTSSSGQVKTEINFCPSARSAADAMQSSGWRRTAFFRLPSTQRAFSRNLHRLFLHSQVMQRVQLAPDDRADYKNDPWTEEEAVAMQRQDGRFLSQTHAIKFVRRDSFNGSNIEEILGTWLAWKDHQVRSGVGLGYGMRAPGLGILCLRTTTSDTEMRLWSTIADILSASSDWWTGFQWSHRDRAAHYLADLLTNGRADPSISTTSAPDLLVIFDEGNFTQERTNRLFPDDFRGQLIDLLNPKLEDPSARHPLDDRLVNAGIVANGCLGPTRILIIYGAPVSAEVEPEHVESEQLDILERLAIFRFGFSIQAAFSIINFERPPKEQISWIEVDKIISSLRMHNAIFRTRGQFYLNPEYLARLRLGRYYRDPKAHFHVAKALVPILEPHRDFVSSNRDRSLEPEPLLEAIWHLHEAVQLTSPRYPVLRNQCKNALATLTLLRPSPDWDTVKVLGRTPNTCQDAVDLGFELLALEKKVADLPPHSSRVAAQLHAIGQLTRHQPTTDELRTNLSKRACNLLSEALRELDAMSSRDSRRQKRRLFSEFAYCMEHLKESGFDDRLSGPISYLNATIREILDPGFLDTIDGNYEGLLDYPIARDWLEGLWSSNSLTAREKSTYAFVACRLSVGNDESYRPWIEYFALTTLDEFDPRQLKNPLVTWSKYFGHDNQSNLEFGRRVRAHSKYESSRDKKNHKVEKATSEWRNRVQLSVRNLWKFVTIDSVEYRDLHEYQQIALQFINAVVMQETLPAFEFLESIGDIRRARFGRKSVQDDSNEWASFAENLSASHAGWVVLLSQLTTQDEDAVKLVQVWLATFMSKPIEEFLPKDPEELLGSRGGFMAIVDRYKQMSQVAVWNGYQILAQRNAKGWAVYGPLRDAMFKIIHSIDGKSNNWFFLLANSDVDPQMLEGVCIMLAEASEGSIETVCNAPALQSFRTKCLRKIPIWKNHAETKQCWHALNRIALALSSSAPALPDGGHRNW